MSLLIPFNVDPELLKMKDLLRQLNFNYFIPCKYKHNIVAILAVSKKEKAIIFPAKIWICLLTLANQLAIVIENHRLFYVVKKEGR